MLTKSKIKVRIFASAAILLCGAAAFTSNSVYAAGSVHGFAVTWFGPAINKGANDCPAGEALMPDKEAFISKAPESEQKKLRDNQGALYQAMAHRGPLGEMACEHPGAIAEKPLRMVEGANAYGVNLDGVGSDKKTPMTCPHKNFDGIDGEADVDNQSYRVIGCMYGYRDEGMGGWLTKMMVSMMRDGNYTVLIEMSGANDLRNSNNVDVDIYSGDDPLVRDTNGGFPRGSSLQASNDPQYHAHTKGKIVDGVLRTEPVDILLKTKGLEMPGLGYLWKGARLKMEIQPDGSLKGILAGYRDWRELWHSGSVGETGSEFSIGSTCPAFYAALKAQADGYPDPQTGECTAISDAYFIEAVPAFIIHSPQIADKSK